jgi:hypothetical protein
MTHTEKCLECGKKILFILSKDGQSVLEGSDKAWLRVDEENDRVLGYVHDGCCGEYSHA